MHKCYLQFLVYMTVSFYVNAQKNCLEHNQRKLVPIIQHAKLIAKEREGAAPHFIAIAGSSGVGKSYFAEELSRLLKQEGVNVAILKGDDFLNPDHFDPHTFHPRLDHALMHLTIQKIKSGEKTVRKPAWNPKEFRPPSKIEEDFSLEGVDLILFEGEFTVCGDMPYNFKQYSKLIIFIDAHDKDIVDWNWNRKRDVEEKTKEEFVANANFYLQRYRNFIKAFVGSATYSVVKDINHYYNVQKN